MSTDLCLVCFMISRSATALAAAAVVRPARRLCPAYLAGSSPTASACFLTMRATALSERRSPMAPAWRPTGTPDPRPGRPPQAIPAAPAQGRFRAACRRESRPAPLPVRVGLRAAQRHGHAALPEGKVADRDADQLRASKSAGKANEKQGAIALAEERVGELGDHRPEVGGQRRRLGGRRRSVGPLDAGPGVADGGVAGVEMMPGDAMSLGDRRQA
jgi:hypothetical protein